MIRFGFGNDLRGYDLPLVRDWRFLGIRVGPQQLENLVLATIIMRLYCVLIGVAFGYALEFGLQIVPNTVVDEFRDSGLFSVPDIGLPVAMSFDATLILPFLIAGIASTVKAVGDLSTAQKINDEDWVAPEMRSIRKGVLADALAVISSAVMGGMAALDRLGVNLAINTMPYDNKSKTPFEADSEHSAYDTAAVHRYWQAISSIATVMNSELDATFDLGRFRHHAPYNEAAGRVEMHLVSTVDQTVTIGDLTVAFEAGETIHTENSYKFTIAGFHQLAGLGGWRPLSVWTDARERFSVHLMVPA